MSLKRVHFKWPLEEPENLCLSEPALPLPPSNTKRSISAIRRARNRNRYGREKSPDEQQRLSLHEVSTYIPQARAASVFDEREDRDRWGPTGLIWKGRREPTEFARQWKRARVSKTLPPSHRFDSKRDSVDLSSDDGAEVSLSPSPRSRRRPLPDKEQQQVRCLWSSPEVTTRRRQDPFARAKQTPVREETTVVVRPRTLKNRKHQSATAKERLARLRSPEVGGDFEWMHEPNPTTAKDFFNCAVPVENRKERKGRVAAAAAARANKENQGERNGCSDFMGNINCYGTPKGERKKKPRSAKKSATEPILYDFLMTDRNNTGRQNVPGGIEMNQISSRIIALTFPTNGSDSAYRHSIKEFSDKLRKNYPDKYKIFNVSQKRSDLGRANQGAVVELGWPDQLAPPLDRLCSICKQIENWLNQNPENLVVIHCKGWRSRAAIVVAAYMHYINICSGDETVEDRFAMQLFSEKYLGTDGQPSHKRYVRYFANLLSGTTKVNPTPIFLTNVALSKLSGKGIVLKIYERMKPVYSSQPRSIKSSAEIEIENGLSLRGDVLVKCFEKLSNGVERSLVFQCQFNTCALNLDPKTPVLHFYKDELDLVTSDRSIDTQTAIAFTFVFDAPKEKKASANGGKSSSRRSLSLSSARDSKDHSLAEFSRADSYENFDRPEDDRSLSSTFDPSPASGAVYTELHKTTSQPTPVPSSSSQPSPLDGADSGIGSDSPKHTMAPQVPPKPKRPPSSLGEGVVDAEDAIRRSYEDSTIGRDHSVLPPGLRPSSRQSRPVSPADSTTARSSSGIEPDLVAKDRYDPSSKCFSYVPAKALKEHYIAPKKPPPALRRPSVEKSNLDIPASVDQESLRSLPLPSTELSRRPETPTWDSVVDKIAPKIDLPDVRKNYRELERERYTNGDYFSKTLPNRSSYAPEEEFERPVVVNQARRAPPPSTGRAKYNSHVGVNEDYNSDMDDLCDPDFYLSYSAAPTPPPMERFGAGSKSVELPRKQFKTVSMRELDELNDIIDSVSTLPPARACYTPKPQPSSSERDAFRARNCRSVTTAPARKLFSNERYDSVMEADNPDDWLKNKLRTLQSKRRGYPDALERKNTERILLEELKNVHDTKNPQASEYVSEGVGKKALTNGNGHAVHGVVDPLEEYQREEERLRNTRSPFAVIDDFRSLNRAAHTATPNSIASSTSRFARGHTPTSQMMRAKPPTPPPRERSRSPARSPATNRRTQSTPREPSTYQQERNRIIASTDYLSDEEEDASEFSHLRGLVPDKRAQSMAPESSHYYANANANGTGNGNGTGTKSILKRGSSQRSTPVSAFGDDERSVDRKDIYASPVPANRRGPGGYRREDSIPRSTIGGSNSASSTPLPFGSGGARAETPAFPVSTTRETPLPFHPLLYQGASEQTGGPSGVNHSLTHRSNSPRSMYYGQSRRSSMTSIDGAEVIHHHPVFVKDTSKYWYKPTISREEAINMLRDKPAGTFIVRDSNSFQGAFGLALKVARPPEGVPAGDGTELVRHFLIEPSPKGVKLKGCNNEPVFGTLAALVYQHSITQMALPCRLILPEYDPASTPEHLNAAQALLEQGAACNVTYIYSFDTESLTGPEAVRRAVSEALDQFARGQVRAVNVHFKVSAQGITLTDNTRTLFFRRHYPANSVIFSGIDPEERKWDNNSVSMLPPTYVRQARVFAFVARKMSSHADNACHVFAELDPEQPASAVVNFITKVMMGQHGKMRGTYNGD